MRREASERHVTTLTTGQLAEMLRAELVGPADIAVSGLSTLQDAGPEELTFIRSDKFAKLWSRSRARAAVVAKGVAVPEHDPASRALLVVAEADLATIDVLGALRPEATTGGGRTGLVGGAAPSPGLHPTAFVDATAKVDATIGSRCIFQPGVVIGGDGFGYRPDPASGGLAKIPHVGNVVIGDGVEIGANSCVDRARFGSTVIGDGTKIDNLVMIAHNCRIGRSCIICGNAGLSGSVTLGDGVMIGGGAGIADNISIGNGGKVAASTGVMADVEPGQTVAGLPALPGREYLRAIAQLRKMGARKG
jgi:UDP-3-O-[3-hydroxymyristoyl] glucosamine N-acyltransferase